MALVTAACGDSESVSTVVPADQSSAETPGADDDTDGMGDDHDMDGAEGHEDGEHDMDGDEHDEHDHDDGHAGDGAEHTEAGDDMAADHDHGDAVEFTGADAPTIEIQVLADPAGGVNIGVTTSNFTVAPRSASTGHVEGEGHFHLWVDGVKTTRFYTDWLHVPGVVEGSVELMVELSANDHRPYAFGGEAIAATVAFDVPAHEHSGHDHDVPDSQPALGDGPELTIEVVADPKSGFNAFVTVDGFEISAEQASGDHIDGVGHLHIYVNGQKLARLYGEAMHIAALPSGDVEVSVQAFTNDHRPYTVDGEPVVATTTIHNP